MSRMPTEFGQLFVLGFPGEQLPPDFMEFVGNRQIGGVILFEENCQGFAQTRSSIEQIVELYDRSTPIIAIDQEGGRVCRLRGAPAEFKSPADYAKANEIEHYIEDYRRAAMYMASLGINLNLTPVADLQLEENNSCLEGRCFGKEPAEAIPFIEATIEVSRNQGLLSCAKHFPGLGAATVDPHQAETTADYDLETWKNRERSTFAAAVEAGVDLIMTTHLSVPKIDFDITTSSRAIVTDLIRNDLRFEGPVISDDLLMSGAEPLGDIGERAVRAFLAGHDLLLICKDYHKAIAAYDYFAKAVV
ncbi:MAG: glycoside hydrolase family 3 N-terminal domain-containing protein, partial [candidate division Zixibacteria bacterium]